MSQENSEIISEEWIAPSLQEPEYPGFIPPVVSIASVDSIDSEDLIFPEYSIDSEDLIFPEYSTDSEDLIFPEYSIDSEDSLVPEYSIDSEDLIFPEYSIDSEDSIPPQEIDIDPLSGMARNFWPWQGPWNPPNNGGPRTALNNARLNIHPDSMWYQNRIRVTATVQVQLSSSQINNGGLVLLSSVWGIDNTIFDRRDNVLFYFPDQHITQSGTYTFTTVVGSGQLDEDRWWFDHLDEIQASISLVSYNRASPLNLRTTTNIFTNYY